MPFSRIAALWRKHALDQELSEEVRAHIDLAADEYRREGLSDEEALAAARRDFGAAEAMKEEYRDQRGIPMIETLLRDVRYGLRSLRRDKAFAASVLLTMMVAIGANTATFAIVKSVLLEPLPVPDAERLLITSNRYPGAGVRPFFNSASGDYVDRLEAVTTFEEQALFNFGSRTMELGGRPERVRSANVTPSFFPLTRVSPSIGRAFSAEDAEPGADRKVILSHGLAQEVFAEAEDAIGRELRLNGQNHTVVGVMPRGFSFVRPEIRMWLPLAITDEMKETHHNNNFYNVGRLRPGATIEQTQSQVDAVNAANMERFPGMKEALVNAGFHSVVDPLEEMLVRDVRSALYLLWGGAFFVLLIGALNVANLALVRLTLRKRETATRLALGARAGQVTRQFIVENLLITLTGGVAGLAVGAGLLRLLGRYGLERIPRADEIAIDGSVLLVALGLAVCTGLLIGLAPLAQAFRANLASSLVEGGRGGTGGRGSSRVRQGLVSAQIGLAFVLLMGAGLLLSSFQELLDVDPGFDSTNVLRAATILPNSRYPDDETQWRFIKNTLERLRATPGVESAGLTNAVPLTGASNDSVLIAEGYEPSPGESLVSPYYANVAPGYFETMRIELLEGRTFDARDEIESLPVIVIDRKLAKRFWGNESTVGRRMYQPRSAKALAPDEDTRWLTVIGVVETVRHEDLAGNTSTPGAYYFPYSQNTFGTLNFVVRTSHDPASAFDSVRRAITAGDPELAVFNVETMSSRRDLSLSSRRMSIFLATGYAGVALLLSAIGIYGVLAHYVAQRRREIGVRVALGSTRAGIVSLVAKQGVVLAGIGLALGVVGAIALRSAIEQELYGVGALEPSVMAGVALVLAMVVGAATLFPARRATAVSPVRALNSQ